jgi:hypothetical protein
MVSPKQAEMLKQSLAQIIPKLDKVSAEVLIKKSK